MSRISPLSYIRKQKKTMATLSLLVAGMQVFGYSTFLNDGNDDLAISLPDYIYLPEQEDGLDKLFPYNLSVTNTVNESENNSIETPKSTKTELVKPIKSFIQPKVVLETLNPTEELKPSNDVPNENKQGIIGKSELFPIDDPSDNTFAIELDESTKVGQDVYLVYDLFGLEDASGVSVSVNDQFARGGYLVKKSEKWTTHKEKINPEELEKGANFIRFSTLENADYQYMVKNVRFEKEESDKNSKGITLNQTKITSYNGYVYISGYSNESLQNIVINGKNIPVKNRTFESIIENVEESITITTENEDLTFPVAQNLDESPDKISDFQTINNYTEQLFSATTDNALSQFGATLKVVAGSMEKDTEFFLSALRFQDLSAVSPEMVNVTGNHFGFRLLPHGEHFAKEPATLEIPYDESKIPTGYKPQDIKTFYFDQEQSKWIALERDTVLLDKKLIVSKTTHFTDFVNGIIKVPESPETGSFTPTSIKDIKAADPTAGVVSIPPPTPNNMGTANTSFPIKLPAGRAGMQPSLSVNYNSEGGNGWMGIGWDISIPSVSIDTRWGAPRYELLNETEIYSFGGGMLTLKNGSEYTNPHRTANISRTSERQFYPRIEGSYATIIRHGSRPNNYWWEVTDKMGNKSFYGGYNGAIVDNAVIKTSDGMIAHWALYRTEDPNGNYVQYNYTKGQSDSGYEFYPESIEYTKHKTAGTTQHYKVSFILDSEITDPSARADIQTNARLGLVQSTSKLLNEIKVDLMEGTTVKENIRSYSFDYQHPNFSKKQLSKISEYDASEDLFYSNTMEYFGEDVTDGDFMNTEVNSNWNGYSDNIEGDLVLQLGSGSNPTAFTKKASLLGSTQGSGFGGGASLGVGLGFDIFSKAATAGVTFDFSVSRNNGLISFIDINGDNLPDKVMKLNGAIVYRPNTGEGFGDIIPIQDISEFSVSTSNSTSFGAEAYFGIHIGYTRNFSKNVSKTYFADVNGDGLPDLIKNGKIVHFNRNETAEEPDYNIRKFNELSAYSPNYIEGGATINGDVVADMEIEDEEDLKNDNPLHDVIKRWVAPVDGTITIKGLVTLAPYSLPDPEDEYINDYDGVRITIEKNTGTFPSTNIPQNIITPPIILTFSSNSYNVNKSVSVNKGDRIYFRVSSIDEGSYDRVEWNPVITYTNITSGGMETAIETVNANGQPYFSSSAKEGFIMSGDGGVTVPQGSSATISFPSLSIPTYTYSDNLTFRILIGTINEETGEFSNITTYTNSVLQNTAETMTLSGFSPAVTSSIQGGKTVKFEVNSNSNVDWKAINWKPQINVSGQTQPTKAVVNYGIYNKKPNTDNSSSRRAVEANKPIRFTIERTNQVFLNDNLEVNDCKKVTLVAKNNQKRVLLTKIFHAKVIQSLGNLKNIALYNNTSSCSGSVVSTMVNTITNTTSITNPIFTEFYTDDWDLAQVGLFKATLMQQDAGGTYNVSRGTSTDIYAKTGNDEYGPGYRNWGQFAYNSNLNPLLPINESDLTLSMPEQDDVPEENPFEQCGTPPDPNDESPAGQQAQEDYDECIDLVMDQLNIEFPDQSKFISMTANPNKSFDDSQNTINVWQGYDRDTYVEEEAFCSSRFGVKNINSILVEIPEGQATLVPGISLISKGKGNSYAGNIPLDVVSFGGNYSHSKDRSLNQFMDMNGDRYPDIITENKIQYTSATGKLRTNTENLSFGEPTNGKSENWGASASGTYVTSETPARPEILVGSIPFFPGLSTPLVIPATPAKPSSSVGINGGIGEGNSKEKTMWMDMNGDGLQDRISFDKGLWVQMNLGYKFDDPKEWLDEIDAITSTNTSYNAGIGFSILMNSFSGGVGVSASEGFTEENLMDLNGDGLPDLVSHNGNSLTYRLNNGNSFNGTSYTISNADINHSRSVGEAASVGFTFGFTILLARFTANPRITPYSKSLSRIERTITDINGDGYPDLLYNSESGSQTNDGDLSVRLNKIGKTHLLKQVNTPLGGSWKIDYEREQNSYEMPNAKWKMVSIEVNDGFTADSQFTPDIAKTSVEYTNGRHDRREREFMGYAEVKVNQLDVINGDAIYRYSLQEFHNNSHYLKGAVKKEALYDANDVEWNSTETTYAIMERGTNTPSNADIELSDHIFNSNDFGTAIDKASLFVSPVKTTKTFYEDGQSKTTFTEIKTFDAYGNITKYEDNGEGGNDKVTTDITYGNSTYRGLPTIIDVKANGSTVRHRGADYDADANLIEVTTRLKASGEEATVTFDYDDYGNITKVTHENSVDADGQKFFYEYTYDDKVHTYPVNITDAFGYSSNNTYDYRFGALVFTEDMNYMPMRTRIDDRGRVVEITGPYELFVEGLSTNDPAWTIRFEYEEEGSMPTLAFDDYEPIDATHSFVASEVFDSPQTDKKHHALTRHFDPEFRTDPEIPTTNNEIYTITLVDGLGKPIQVKKSTSIKTAVTNPTGEITAAVIDARETRKWLINGKVETDAFGRAVKTWYPTEDLFSLSGQNPAGTAYDYIATVDTAPPTEATYDVLDRVLTTKLPGEQDLMTTAYAIDNSLFKTTVTNELSQTKHSFTDVRGRTVKVVENSSGGNIETTFEYNAIGELLKVTDAGGNPTISEYDLAGRRTKLTHPDNGITLFEYDAASNLQFKETANLSDEGNNERIEYHYTFNRLDSISYPKNPHNNVHFFYGAAQDASAADDFSVGRLWYQIDASGVQQFKYGRLGEVRYNLRSVAVPGDKAYWFKTEWEYDTWNRVKKIIYPDEEEITYFYNRGGELHAITSKKQEQQNENIISQLGYDKFGQRTYLRYGNGTETEYTYEDNRRRLENMAVKNANRTFIDNDYIYDVLSNVKEVHNNAALPTTGQIGGTVSYTYGYDDLNRLTTANAIFTGRNATDNGYEQQQYTLAMEYDNLHNIVSKEQLHQKAPGQSGGTFTDIPSTTYKLDYAYEADNKPHAPREIIDKPYATSTGNDIKTKTYDYDANGNMTKITQKTGESETIEKLRTNLWDEENRLRAVDITPDAEGVRPIAIYTYDAGGERILKHSNTSVSIYLNGKKVADTIQVDATLYPSGMLVARVIPTEEESLSLGYTKHYYAGTQRVSSKIGTTENLGEYLQDWYTGGTGGPVDVVGSSFGVLDNAEEGVVQVYTELGIDPPPTYDSDPVFIPVASFIHGDDEIEQYYFHPDHLGSTSYISNILGEVSQHMEYFAFGETFVEEHRSSNNSPYKFNGKELDEETGWYYYGARYYDPRTSVWLSVDPLAEKYPNYSPYAYTFNNPINFIDPTGMEGEGWGKKYGEDGKATWEYSNLITADNYKDLGFSDYMDSGNVFSTTNDIADGRYNYSLNADGTVQDSQGSSMGSKFKTGAGTTISNLDKDNSMVGFARRAYMSGNHDPAYSPYTPDAMSVNIGASGNWYVANYDVSLSLIFSPGNISIGGNAGGGLGIDSDMPFKNISPFSLYGSVGFHDTYGDETNVIEGLRGWSTTATYSGGPFSISRSTSANLVGPNALLPPAPSGVKSTFLGYAPRSTNVGVNGFGSYSGIYSFFK